MHGNHRCSEPLQTDKLMNRLLEQGFGNGEVFAIDAIKCLSGRQMIFSAGHILQKP